MKETHAAGSGLRAADASRLSSGLPFEKRVREGRGPEKKEKKKKIAHTMMIDGAQGKDGIGHGAPRRGRWEELQGK